MIDVLVLCYHAVSAEWPAQLAVRPECFERQLHVLRRRGFQAATFTEAVSDPPAERTVAITFDDAYRSVFEQAAPILQRLDMPATVFAPTAFVDQADPMSWPGIDDWARGEYGRELLPMSWAEMRQLHEAGWEIGSHTRTHPHLPSLAPERLPQELEGSRATCEQQIPSPCRSLAFPYGDYDAGVVEAARRAGYSAAGAMSGRTLSAGPLEWPRVPIYRRDGDLRFAAKISRMVRRVRGTRAWRLRMQFR